MRQKTPVKHRIDFLEIKHFDINRIRDKMGTGKAVVSIRLLCVQGSLYEVAQDECNG